MQYALQIYVRVLAHLPSPLHRIGMHRGWYVVSFGALQGIIILLCAASFQKDASWASLSYATSHANRNKFRRCSLYLTYPLGITAYIINKEGVNSFTHTTQYMRTPSMMYSDVCFPCVEKITS
jgi:hypothetical protein